MALRILHLTPYFKPDVAFGGPVFSVSALCDALVAAGEQVTVFTIGYEADEQYPIQKKMDGLTVWYFKGDMGKPCQISFQLWQALDEQAKNFDIIHLHTWWNVLIFRSIQIIKRQGVPMVVSPRGMLSSYSFTHRKTQLKRWFQATVGKSLMQGVALHATSTAEAADMAERAGVPIENIYNFPNLLALPQGGKYLPGNGGYKLGFLSRLHHKKGIEILLEAMAISPEVDELIVGGGGDEAYEIQLKAQVAKLGLTHKVRFVGWVAQEQKADFFKKFDVFILPSFSENFANVVAEAWAAGKPVIISTEVGLSEYLSAGNLGWLCAPELNSLAAAIKAACNGRHQWQAMGEAALALVGSNFTDSRIMKQYLRMYEHEVSAKAPFANTKGEKLNSSSPASTQGGGVYILGINAYHADASAALLLDGQLIAATEEERFTRVKHWAGFPKHAIQFCLNEAGIDLADVTQIAFGRDPKAKWRQKALFALQHPNALTFAIRGRLSNAEAAINVKDALSKMQKQKGAKQTLNFVEHHRSHLASAYYASPFETAALLSIDGSGDFSTTMMGIGRGIAIEIINSIDFPHSLGIFYTAFTQLLGFPHYGDEYKVMGLAPYGQPIFADKMKDVISLENDGTFKLNPRFFRPPEKGYISYNKNHQPEVPVLFTPALEDSFGTARTKDEPLQQHHFDMAATVQHMTEQTIFHLLRHLHRQTGLTALCLSGGVAQNSVANGKITRNTPFTSVFVPPAGHDAGLSIGAAWYVHYQKLGQKVRHPITHGYTGASFANEEIEILLKNKQVIYTKHSYFSSLCIEVVDCISNGGVVGWFRGKSEFGPRALGNRSILADPRRADAKQILNEKIKRRESFRPFAPSILAEYTAEYFELTDEVPFMEKVFPIRADKRAIIPAVTHVDGSGRLQTVSKASNIDFYQLIDCFRRKTGIPILLNTSFNENEPIVNTPAEALDCFLRTKMDLLVLEDFIISRPKDEH